MQPYKVWAIIMGVMIGIGLLITRKAPLKEKILTSLFMFGVVTLAWRISQGEWFPSLPEKNETNF